MVLEPGLIIMIDLREHIEIGNDILLYKDLTISRMTIYINNIKRENQTAIYSMLAI